MKRKLILIALTACMLFPANITAAEPDTVIRIIETGIRADSVFNTEGYGSLTLNDETGQNAPQYALLNADGGYIFPYGAFPCQYSLSDGLFVNGVTSQQADGSVDNGYSLFDLSGNSVIGKTYDYLSFQNGYGIAITRTQASDGSWQFQDIRELINAGGETVLTLPDGFNLVTSAGGGAFEFELRSWGTGYFGSIGDYGDGLLWLSTAAGVQQNIAEAQGITEDSQVFKDNSYQMGCFGGPYCGYVDLQGNVVIPPQYYSVTGFSDGLAAVQEYVAPSAPVENLPFGTDLGGKWKYIDTAGNDAFSGEFSAASGFSNGYAYVADDEGKYGYINTQGQTVIPMVYDSAFGGESGLFSVGSLVDGQMKYGLVDENNQVVVPLEYDDLSNVENGTAYGIKNGVVYIVRAQPDVPSAWAEDEVAAAAAAGIVPENLQKNYTGAVSRGEVAGLFVCLLEKASGTDIDSLMTEHGVQIDSGVFTDTTDKNVLAANALGIISGVGDNRFDPDGSLTRAQIAAILNRMAGVLGVQTEGYSHSFNDVSGHWAESSLGWPVHAGIISGVGEDRFDPDGLLTTEQAIVIAMRALNALS